MMCYLLQENCIVYHKCTANVFSNMERIYHQTLYKFRSVRETAHKKLYPQRILTLDMEDKTFSIFGYEEGANFKNQGFR
jgi:hypothetical protein